MVSDPKLPASRFAGFSLVEIMVGLAIGMLAVIVILQVFALSGERQRNASSGGDAQSNGAIALYQLQKDIGGAGYGFASSSLFNCNIKWTVSSTGSNIATAVPLAPVTVNPAASIIPVGDPNTDRLLIMYGNTNQEPQGNVVSFQSGNIYTLQMPTSFNVDDRVVAAPMTCAADLLIDKITSVGATTVTAQTGAANVVTLYNLGSAPTILAYAIRNGNLTMCDYVINDCGLDADKDDTSIWVPIANSVISMKAQYEHDNSADPDKPFDQTTPTTGCGWAHTPMVRLALVVRNTEFSKDEVTSDVVTATVPIINAPTWMGTDGSDAADAALPIDLTKKPDNTNNPDWKHYRYKVSQSVVPIRNVAWMSKTGCP